MKRLKTITLVLDPFAEPGAVAEAALSVAKATGARVNALVAVSEKNSTLEKVLRLSGFHTDTETSVEELSRPPDWLGGLQARFEDAGIAFTSAVRVGKPFIEIILQASATDADIIMLDALKQTTLSPTEAHVLRKSPCPVWVVRDTGHPVPRTVVAAVDPQEDDADRMSLAKNALQFAGSLAVHFDAALHLVHCYDGSDVHAMQRSARFRMSDVDAKMALAYQHRLAHKNMDTLIKDCPPETESHETHIFESDPAEGVARVAEATDADVVVIGTVAETGIPGLFIGSTAETTFNLLRCSIFAVKPDGFVSPITPDSGPAGTPVSTEKTVPST